MTAKETHVAGYVADVPYLRHFCPELAPPLLRAVVAGNGIAPPPEERFTFGELGCGQGDSTATLAAAFPHSDFWGFDLLPSHVAHGEALAKRGGLANIRFLEADFATMDRRSLPSFDYLGAHGVLSWISPEVRRALLELAAEKLKPGGLLYVGYNALPGWAALEPLRRILLDAAPAGESSLVRARKGLEAARRLADGGAEYFVRHPTAKEMLATMEAAGLPYVAHEYLHDHWSPLAITELAREAGAVGLTYAGQIPLHRNVNELTFPAALMPPPGTDVIEVERQKDLVRNTFFRADVFIKGAPPRSDAVTLGHVESTRFGTRRAAAQIPRAREVLVGSSTFRVEGALVEALISRLAHEAGTLSELSRDPTLAPFGASAIRTALVQLMLAEIAEPRPTRAGPDPSMYNRAAIDAAFRVPGPVILASSRAGTGITLSRMQAVFLRVAAGGSDRATALDDLAHLPSLDLWKNDQKITEPMERARLLAAELEAFEETELEKLTELGLGF